MVWFEIDLAPKPAESASENSAALEPASESDKPKVLVEASLWIDAKLELSANPSKLPEVEESVNSGN
ncbi:hypothetical protein NDA13_004398 [Ustilago tritici]|nr:hypothetical protein NDA13_004398 [Ustilago tritici]